MAGIKSVDNIHGCNKSYVCVMHSQKQVLTYIVLVIEPRSIVKYPLSTEKRFVIYA